MINKESMIYFYIIFFIIFYISRMFASILIGCIFRGCIEIFFVDVDVFFIDIEIFFFHENTIPIFLLNLSNWDIYIPNNFKGKTIITSLFWD